MGIFIKFECDNCGEYECDCSSELRNPPKPPPPPYNPNWSKIEPKVTNNDIIATEVTKDGKIINQAWIHEVNKEGDIFVSFLDDRDDGLIVKWEYPNHIKISSVIGEYK